VAADTAGAGVASGPAIVGMPRACCAVTALNTCWASEPKRGFLLLAHQNEGRSKPRSGSGCTPTALSRRVAAQVIGAPHVPSLTGRGTARCYLRWNQDARVESLVVIIGRPSGQHTIVASDEPDMRYYWLINKTVLHTLAPDLLWRKRRSWASIAHTTHLTLHPSGDGA
jgi:hypothetical protein